MSPRTAGYWLAGLIVLAVAVRLAFCYALYPHYFIGLSTVGSEYFFDSYREIAANVVSGEGFVLDSGVPVIHRPPGYVLIMAASLPSRPETSRFIFQLWNALFGGIAVMLTFRLARELRIRTQLALIAALVVALWPFSIWETKVTVPENILVALLPALGLLLLKLHRTPSLRIAALAGLLSGVVTLFHATYQVLLFLIPILLILVRAPRLRRIIPVFVLAFSCLVAPWVMRNHLVAGYTGISAGFGLHYFKGVYAFDQLLERAPYFKDHDVPATEWVSQLLADEELGPIVTNEARSDPRRNAYLDSRAISHMIGSPGYTLAKVVIKLPLAWVHQQSAKRSALTAVLLLPLFGLLLMNARRLLEPERALLLGLMLGINLAVALVFSEAIPMRYVLPLVPLLAVLSMGGLESGLERDDAARIVSPG
jgi:4-amino-4-deoxy-L-arabinose transferase-like glycosyltransferase